MEIFLERLKDSGTCTVGIIKLNNKFQCFALEDTHHKVKIKGHTRIPEGRYRIVFRKEGGMIQKYKKKFSNHPGMLHLLNVPNYRYVYIHIGNTHKDTDGCILVGESVNSERGFIGNSTAAYVDLYKIIKSYLDKGEEVWINVN